MNDNNVMICQDENGITKGTSDWIETMNETIKYDIIKPTNKGGEKNWSRERLLTLSTAVVKRRQDEKIEHVNHPSAARSSMYSEWSSANSVIKKSFIAD